MEGKTVLVTGGSSGVGKAAAAGLARLGARVLIVCRRPETGQKALADIREESGSEEVYLLLADLSLMEEVRRLAGEVKQLCPKLDVLINNVGIMPGRHTLTPEGHEVGWATNYLSAFLLTNLLTDWLLAADQGRIINVVSEAHRLGEINLADFTSSQQYSPYTAYCDSKLALMLFTFELASRIELTSLTCNCFHPGRVATNFAYSGNPIVSWLFKLGRPFMASPAEGAKPLVHLASSPEAGSASGQYFNRGKIALPAAESRNRHLARRLWALSETATGLVEVS